MSTEDFWEGDFGNEYVKRCRVDWRKRMWFWDMILSETGARSVHEFGCNCGWNLSAIRRKYPDVILSGNDVNLDARVQARAAGLDVVQTIEECNRVELVFSAGVLIHIASEDLQKTMQSIIDASTDFVLCVEYYADKEEEVLYRGHKGKLWKRPYGKLYQDMGLELFKEGFVGSEDGFDDCNWTLLRKPYA